MGLDNGITFKIKCPSLNIKEKEYEVCYFRKYWGLRDEILQRIGGEYEEYEYPLDRATLAGVAEILERYTVIDNVRDAELSTIWSEAEECYHIRDEYKKIQFAKDFCEDSITLYEFLYMLFIWQSGWRMQDGINKKLMDWFEMNESPPEDLEWSFEFYDSY